MVIIFKKGNKKDQVLQTDMSTIKHLSTNEKAREDTRRKPATRTSWIQKRILNDRPHPRRKQTEGDVQTADNIISHAGSHSSIMRKPLTHCKLKQY